MEESTSNALQKPNRHLRAAPFWILLSGLLGGLITFGGFTFLYAQGTSYLSDDAKACANCHIMRDVYTAWNHGSHKAVAVCNDCHTPHDSFVTKYAVKAINGFNHSLAFTTGNFPEPIRITAMNRDIAQQNCVFCHGSMTSLINHGTGSQQPVDCLRCHAKVGHEP